jgi:hypothetical protein
MQPLVLKVVILGKTEGALPVSWILLSSYIQGLYRCVTEIGCAVPTVPLKHYVQSCYQTEDSG